MRRSLLRMTGMFFLIAFLWIIAGCATPVTTFMKSPEPVSGYKKVYVLEAIYDPRGVIPKVVSRLQSLGFEVVLVKKGQSLGPQQGSGFIISRKGHILTCAHLVKGQKEATVWISGKRYEADIIQEDVQKDLAVLKVRAPSDVAFKPLTPSRTDKLSMGQDVFTMGFPMSRVLGNVPRLNKGLINSTVGLKDNPDQLQVSVEIQPGNSGSPLFNNQKEVIGIITSTISPLSVMIQTQGSLPQNVNFALKAGPIRTFLERCEFLQPPSDEMSTPSSFEEIKDSVVQVYGGNVPTEKPPELICFVYYEHIWDVWNQFKVFLVQFFDKETGKLLLVAGQFKKHPLSTESSVLNRTFEEIRKFFSEQSPSPEEKELRLLTDVYGLIKREYITPVPFPDLVENTLKGLQNLLGKERLSYVRTDHRFLISCSGEEITVDDVADENRRMKGFADIFGLVKRTNPQLSEAAIVDSSIKGLVQLDPHSSFMPPDTYKRMQEYYTKGRDESIGVNTLFRNGVLMVTSLVDNSPAAQAGISPGDQIILIDGVPTKDLGSLESHMRLSGPKGTNVTVTIMREGFTGPREFVITRDLIPFILVRYRLLEGRSGYIRISEFSEKTDAEFDKVIKTLDEESKGSLKGLILDLRNNSGGLVDQCIKLADRFIESGLVISMKGRTEDQKLKLYAHRKGTLPHYPLVVLTNTETAAGAEIVAGALQDHKRAIIVGSRTLGMGTIQTFFPLRDGSCLRLTTAKWLTPNGKEIEGKGILPDLIVISKKDKSLSSVPSDRPMIVVESNEKEAILRIALQILKNTSSSSFQDLMGAAKKINGIEMEQQQSDTPLKK